MGLKIISLKTAKLAKEKAFMEFDGYWYKEGKGSLLHEIEYPQDEVLCDYIDCKMSAGGLISYEDGFYFATSQAFLQTWIREKCGLVLTVYPNASGYLFEISKNPKQGGCHVYDSGTTGPNEGGAWDNYEDALEEGLLFCLNLIPNE